MPLVVLPNTEAPWALTEKKVFPPICKSIIFDVVREAVLVTFSFKPVNNTLELFQVSVMFSNGAVTVYVNPVGVPAVVTIAALVLATTSVKVVEPLVAEIKYVVGLA